MPATETVFIVLALVFTALIILGVVLRFFVTFFKSHRSSLDFGILLSLVLTVVMASCAAATHYKLNTQGIWASGLLGASGGLAVAAILMTLGMATVSRRVKMSLLTAAVVLIVLLLQTAVNVAHPYQFDSNNGQLSGGVLLTRVISETFRYFSLDAEYTAIVSVGATALPDGGRLAFYILACAMTVIAPIVGGFAIFGVLGHFFPKLSLLRSIQPTKYVFSELNEYSIETAESIVKLKNKLISDKNKRARYIDLYGRAAYREIMRSIIVFTDVYSNKKEETDAELLQRAHKIGAICLKDDILSRKIYWMFGVLYPLFRVRKKVVYFLMDKSDFYIEQGDENNLRTAVSLLTTDDRQAVWKKTHWLQTGTKADSVEIYVFSRSENADAIISDAHKKWKDKCGGRQTVAYKTINEYQNLVYGLINGTDEDAFPLYTGLEQPHGSKTYNTEKLSVLIVGGGRIAKTFLKTVYYCGQMLKKDGSPTDLHITVMSKDARVTEYTLRADMPMVFDGSQASKSYCKFDFIPVSYGTERFVKEFEKVVGDKQGGISVDYILVALGADNLNMQAADLIKQILERLGKQNAKCNKVVPVNYVIENNALCEALGGNKKSKDDSGAEKKNSKKKKEQAKSDNKPKAPGSCVLNPFGALNERFDFQNISMAKHERLAIVADKEYSNNKSKITFTDDKYGRDSSIASAMHSPYKSICIDIDSADFDKRAFWLEHRRWSAYMRSIGYRSYTLKEFARLLEFFVDNDGYRHVKSKNTGLKLHACIMECSDNLTDISEINGVISNDFYKAMFAVLKTVKRGETFKYNHSGKEYSVESMEDFYEYMRRKFGRPDLDDLDILSAMVSGRKLVNGNREFKPVNYKSNDINIARRMHFDRMCDKIVSDVFDKCSLAGVAECVAAITKVYKNYSTTDYEKKDNVVVLRQDGELFAFIGRRRDYDLFLWCADEDGINKTKEKNNVAVFDCASDKFTLSAAKKGFILKQNGLGYAVIAVKPRRTAKLVEANKKHYLAYYDKENVFKVEADNNTQPTK